MKVEGKPVKRRRTCCTCCEGLACARHVTRVVQHPVFNVVVDFLIVVNVVVLAIDTWFGSDVFLVSGTEVVFVLVFGIEVSLRVTAAGVRAYFREWTNVLDFAVVLATTLDLLLTLTPINTPDLYRFLLLLRTLRLWTTVNRIKRFRVILSSLVQLTPALATYASVQVMLFYVFAIVGMASFDGLIYEGNPALNGTTFAAPPSYAANNFNDFFSSLVTLTELMIVNQARPAGGAGFFILPEMWIGARFYLGSIFLGAAQGRTSVFFPPPSHKRTPLGCCCCRVSCECLFDIAILGGNCFYLI